MKKLACALLALICLSLFSPAEESRPARATEKSPRVILIGIDGADLRIIDRLISRGKLPTFARLEREGAFGALRSQEPLLSPIVWTTIATGRRPQDHGVLDFVEVAPDGKPTPITSTRRRVPALWNIATEFGKTSGFVGWYASYPAERISGFMVSDRLGFHQVSSARAVEGATFPEPLVSELRSRFGEPAPDLTMTRRRFLADPGAPVSADGEKRLLQLARIYATSEFYRKIVPYLHSRFPTDLLALYFEGIDACGHLFMEDAPPRLPEISAQDFHAFSEVVDRYYEYQDEVLSDLLRLEGPRTVSIVLSDHGFKTEGERPRTSGRADTGLAPVWHRLYGALFVHGASVVAHQRLDGATILDIAPTVVALLSLPMSGELPGRPLSEAFTPGGLGAVRRVARYALPARRDGVPPAPSDSETVQKLLALGYLAGGGSLAHDSEGRTSASYLNEATARSRSGDIEGALRAYGRTVELDPKNVNALVAAAAIYLKRGESDRAKPLIDRASRVDPGNFWLRVQRAVWDLQKGLYSAAGEELAAAQKLDDRLPILHLVKARYERAIGNPAAALEELKAVEGLTDLDDVIAEALVLKSEIHLDLNRLGEARADLERAARYAPAGQLAAARGDLASREGNDKSAEELYRQAIAQNPDSSPLELKLGDVLALRSPAEAEKAFRRAVRKARTDEEREKAYGTLALLCQSELRDPDALAVLKEGTARVPGSSALWGMLGAARGRTGDLAGAIVAYERSVALKPTALACKTLAALVFEERHDRDRAIELWKESLRLDPNQPDVQRFLAKYAAR